MAGSFGFEKAHYDVSIAAGERVLLPAVRTAPKETLIVADGFSCREQIAQGTDRRGVHLAEAMQMALRGVRASEVECPERRVPSLPGRGLSVRHVFAIGALSVVAGLVARRT
jgi:hypothetical protein